MKLLHTRFNWSVIGWGVLLVIVGCARMPPNSPDTILMVRFRGDPLDYNKGELIQGMVITAVPASIYRIDKIPYDWQATANFPDSFTVTCELVNNHGSFATWNIHDFDDVVYLRVTRGDEDNLDVSAQIAISEGPNGLSRTLTIDPEQITLEPTDRCKDRRSAQQTK